jgi:hypothetical protein
MSGSNGEMLFMRDEKEKILACTEGFGPYTYAHNDHRAKYLASAFDTMLDPDYVYECEKLKTARYSFVKEYKSKPYPFTVFLVGIDGKVLVPTTSFPCKRNDVKKWRCGSVVYSRNTDAAG